MTMICARFAPQKIYFDVFLLSVCEFILLLELFLESSDIIQ